MTIKYAVLVLELDKFGLRSFIWGENYDSIQDAEKERIRFYSTHIVEPINVQVISYKL